MNGKRISLAVAATLFLAPSSALAWWAFNRHQVEPVGNGVFEVVAEVGSAPKDFWCGAGDYAIRVLRTSATQRIYIWKAIAPSTIRQGRKGVQFALQPPPGADTSTGYSLTVKREGDNLNAAMAQGYCYDRRAEDLWLPT
ncbi:hypothetical protein [Primorskyibacter sp. S87]|uniref:hypothetical protein n=1 Tax=Primorskyibacter sp. S87 TaxID=3415126 RepID=UPI003C7B69DC